MDIAAHLGLALVLLGGVWILQGLNRQWVLWGALLGLVGVAQIVWSNTRERYCKSR